MNYEFNLTQFVSISYIKYITFFLFLFVITSIIVFIICSYIVLKILKLKIDDNNIIFHEYNKKNKKILDLYGDHKLTKIYLIRQPLNEITTFIINIITFYNYDKLIKEPYNHFPYHIAMIFEIKLPNNSKKLILLEKNNSINICENFFINNLQGLKQIKLKKNKNLFTINSILKTTQERLGNEKFFNWHIYRNNCKGFIKEILKTMNYYNKDYKNFIFGDISIDKLVKTIIPTEFATHIVNSLVNINNIIEKYVFDNNVFN